MAQRDKRYAAPVSRTPNAAGFTRCVGVRCDKYAVCAAQAGSEPRCEERCGGQDISTG